MRLEGKVVVVTGGGSGMGRELVLGLLNRDARVAAVDRNPATLDETAALAGARRGDLSLHAVDITDRAAIRALPEAVVARFGVVDGVFNNAGIIQPFLRLNDLDDAAIDRVLNVNLFGTLHMTRAFLPLLLARPEAHIVNTSSMGGFLPVPGQTVYGASKAAVKLLTEGLYAELQGTRVHVTVVFPGAVGTNIAANSGVEIAGMADDEKAAARTLSAQDAARIILDGVERNQPRILVGRDARMMDALYRIAPVFATRFIAGQMRALLS